ncbi:adenylyl-sulfate reductase subunit alpha [uncultured Mitsuokella sp.]|uniref:adenylyl-sulfate reductase subunit alpha n=1 Tax=uncultured Mitsuokella sp. TaxID=453120 RepID=UPI0026702C82|nr:adenylyl-sulfate reductase subunit alpha [uncultured Mitsuokella sp.]
MKETTFERRRLVTDVLIIGGGTAGCYAAIKLGKEKNLHVLVAEKANIERSGCLAAGVNALNAYISSGHTPEDYVEYARKDAEGIIRDDLMLTIAQKVNAVTKDLEERGLVILKDEQGRYVTRGWRNVKINGENIKPLLAKGARAQENVTVLNHVNITDLKIRENQVYGAWGFSNREVVFYDIDARAVLISTGGAAGLYRPNNPGFSRHKMWYPPFNTGAGYAMGIRAGAEMTTLEHRFVALRCKDTIAPTGTIAQGVGAKQVNARGAIYETKYGLTTPQRIYGTVEENRKGHGPCYLDTRHITETQQKDLYHAYLNMAPAQTLKWIESGRGPQQEPVEVEGTEPYVVGGHTASGFWVDTKRETTVKGLFAAGDVAGGAPQKYVTGALAEGEIAAGAIREFCQAGENADGSGRENTGKAPFAEYEAYLSRRQGNLTTEQMEEAMQKIMDEYAGGIRTDYRYNESRLTLADEKIQHLEALLPALSAADTYELMKIYELRERLLVCRALIAHLSARHETRWHTFGENADYPEQSPAGLCYINSRFADGSFHMYRRPLVKGEHYEHKN